MTRRAKEVEIDIEVSASRARRVKSDGFESVSIVEGQPRGLRGPSDMEIDGSVIGHHSGFSRARMGEKQRVEPPKF